MCCERVDTPFYIRNGFGYDRGFEDFVWVRGRGDDTGPHERWDAPDYHTARYREGYGGERIYPCYGKWEEAGLTRDEVDLAADPGEQSNAYTELADDGEALCERALTFLELIGTPEEYIAPAAGR